MEFSANEIIGLDLSLTSTGVATHEGEFSIRPKNKGVERLISIRDALLERIWERDFVIVEGYAMGIRNSGHTFSLGELGGIVRVAFHEQGTKFAVAPPSCRAKLVTGKGNSSKYDVISHITSRTGRVWEGKDSTDLADAWALRELGLVKFGLSEYDWPKNNLKALDGVDWNSIEDTENIGKSRSK